MEISLNGKWEVGTGRHYSTWVTVPGLATNPAEVDEDSVWYRREVTLSEGSWTHATLVLNGARFCPAVYVNGVKVSQTPGGMTATTHLLDSPDVVPGAKIMLEISLMPLDEMDLRDASRIPKADWWRSNVSCCLWDDVTLRLHGPARINRLIPFPDIDNDRVSLHWEAGQLAPSAGTLEVLFEIVDSEGKVVASVSQKASRTPGKRKVTGVTDLDLKGACRLWSPEEPTLYTLQATLSDAEVPVDVYEMNFGFREFGTDGLGFVLNNAPTKLRAGTVVWHRWVRDPEARELAFDIEWFERNVVERLKNHGANTLRFHLGMPPEAFLELCDRHGLMVQAEWSFFHGMEGSEESLVEQWRSWLDLCMRHPSVVLIHAWNETEDERLKIAWAALDKLAPEFPPLVLAHRHVIHVHKYWWSLFENVGCYYDSAAQFDRPIMVDEFGGNYLDGEGNPGGYSTLKSAFLRFLGRGHTAAARLEHHTISNARIAEYWRRIDAAGISPFCIAGSWEDGNHWFLGPLREANPKPVWDALTASWSPLSVSIEVWDRNYEPGQEVTLPVYFFNDTHRDEKLRATVKVCRAQDGSESLFEQTILARAPAHSIVVRDVKLRIPDGEGDWRFLGKLETPPSSVKHPVISSWDFRTFTPKVPEMLQDVSIGVADDEIELKAFLKANGLNACQPTDHQAKILLTSRVTWEKLIQNPQTLKKHQDAIDRGCSVVMLDIGPIYLGEGYLEDRGLIRLQGRRRVETAGIEQVEIFGGIKARFKEAPEPESHLHPSEENDDLWKNLDKEATSLWNGMRGGLIVPATDMELTDLGMESFIASWVARGAERARIQSDSYFAYELQGYYAFSRKKDDADIQEQLREKVRAFVEDAPALADRVNPEAPIRIVDLVREYRASQKDLFLEPLAVCGPDLTRVPLVQIGFGDGKGTLILSQLLTAGRLAKGFGEDGLYGIRYDPAAVQFVLNMLEEGIRDNK